MPEPAEPVGGEPKQPEPEPEPANAPAKPAAVEVEGAASAARAPAPWRTDRQHGRPRTITANYGAMAAAMTSDPYRTTRK